MKYIISFLLYLIVLLTYSLFGGNPFWFIWLGRVSGYSIGLIQFIINYKNQK
jgi:hypothetical protein